MDWELSRGSFSVHRRLIIIIIVCANLSVDVLRQLHTALIVTESWKLHLAAYDNDAGALGMETNKQLKHLSSRSINPEEASDIPQFLAAHLPPAPNPQPAPCHHRYNHEDSDQEPISDHSPYKWTFCHLWIDWIQMSAIQLQVDEGGGHELEAVHVGEQPEVSTTSILHLEGRPTSLHTRWRCRPTPCWDSTYMPRSSTPSSQTSPACRRRSSLIPTTSRWRRMTWWATFVDQLNFVSVLEKIYNVSF